MYLTLRTRNLADVEILGDDKRLTWALEHLVRNATAYNLKNGKVSIQAIVATIEEKPYVLIQVSDNGVGISEKDLPHIFERFYRGEPRTAEGKRLDPRGLGQGLFIAKTISEAHGGYLTVQSKVGGRHGVHNGTPTPARTCLNRISVYRFKTNKLIKYTYC